MSHGCAHVMDGFRRSIALEKAPVRRLAQTDEPYLDAAFGVAEKFHATSTQFMQDYDLNEVACSP